ncbi:pyridoxal phosphate-dependent aminotransferase [Candidatus Bipolaricaulota bacterium]|nr:pyridoxal phosphate-dependent aminotransferase [Candidatus Bipolaricaulota bacterium]
MSSFISQRAKNLPYSGIREIFDLAGKMEDVIHFEIGEPDFDTPLPIVEAAFEAAKKGMTHYTPSAGIKSLREKLAAKLTEELEVQFDPDEIVITAGGMEALLLIMLVTLNKGDEVLLPSPHWPNYPAHVLLAGGKYKKLVLEQKHEFKLVTETLKNSITENTKVLLINYPHNPTGAVLDREDLEVIADVARANDLLVFSDEAYESLVFDGKKFLSIASLERMKERTVILRTFSKSYAMTGWRVGYLAAPKQLADKTAKLHEHTSACTSSVSQMAALAALELPVEIPLKMVKEYERRRDILIAELAQIPGLKVFKPRGTFYAFVDIRQFGIPSFDLSRLLLEKARVAVAPGSAFGAEGEGYIRVCFANSTENIRKGVKRMGEVFQELAAGRQRNDVKKRRN